MTGDTAGLISDLNHDIDLPDAVCSQLGSRHWRRARFTAPGPCVAKANVLLAQHRDVHLDPSDRHGCGLGVIRWHLGAPLGEF